MLKVEPHNSGPRLYLFGNRIHHGTVGILFTIIGAGLLIHDRADFPFTDSRNH
jgi:hypothetical protein